MAESLVIAKKDRAVIRASVNKFIENIENSLNNPSVDILELEELLEQLNEVSNELKKIDSEIKKLVQENQLETELQSAEEYREKITTWRFRANRKIKQLDKKISIKEDSVESELNNSMKESCNIKLPKFQINKFAGNSSEWLSFWSAFETAIHNNNNLDPVDKFNYLRAYLTGSALNSVQGFAVTADNYLKAIDIITQRFGRKETLINVHMNNLLNIKHLKYSSDTKNLRKLYDDIQTQIRSLESLEVSLSSYSNLLCPIILKALPRDLILEFNKENVDNSYDVQQLINFIYKQLNSRERMIDIQSETEVFSPPKDYKSFEKSKRFLARPCLEREKNRENKNTVSSACELFVQNRSNEKCNFCDAMHETKNCSFAAGLPFEDRLNLLRKKGICFCCLKTKHVARNCNIRVICRLCGGNHADIMCKQKTLNNVTDCVIGKEIKNQSLSNQVNSSKVYLQTLIVKIKGFNTSGYIRILIDTGSENTYISKYAAEKLKLRKIKTERIIHGLFGGIQKTEEHNRYQFTLNSLDNKFTCKIEALDQKKICSGINLIENNDLIKTLEENNVFLSDVYKRGKTCIYEENPEEIHLLLGADMASNLFTENVKYFSILGLTAFETKLGWTIMGRKRENYNTENSLSVLSLSLHVSNINLAELWRLDTLGISNEENKTKLELEEETQKHFLKTVKRDTSGRYEVSLPWVLDQSVLPSNRSLAEKSLYKTEKLLINTNNKREYTEIFNFWESNGIIEEITDNKTQNVHFLPHRPVIKETSETTPIRPVYNCSAHSKGSPSLNDCLTKGPNLIEIIPSILNKFRKYKIGISSDIEKAFLQIKVTERDRDFLRFFWFNEDGTLKTYRHCCVVFGLSSSPYLLMATLEHLLNQVPQHLFETAKILKNSFYIDNSLTSLDSEQDTKQFIQESKAILASGHFNLRCWRSNLPMVMIAEEENAPKLAPVLGLMWDLETDKLFCQIDEKIKMNEPFTKRKILSITQKIFDPIGFTSPVTLVPKLLLQKTWIQKLGWDEQLPESLKNQFTTWLKRIDLLPQIQIPRWLNIQGNNRNEISLHVFADASKNAYAACVYVRIKTEEGVKIQLINARSRVAPIKALTIPRLELVSCLISTRLAKTIKSDLQLENTKTIFWSDSTTALGWIRREQTWATFVHNRVTEIRRLSNIKDWRHVPGNLNPADLPSRGCSFEQLKMSKWWEGPQWLYLPENDWPQTEEQPDENLINKEKRKTILTLVDKENDRNWYYRYFSSYKKIVKMLAWICRFLSNLKNLEKNLSACISIEEYVEAEKMLFKLIQKESFTGRNDPNIRALRPVEDEKGLLRAKTNLIQRQDYENFRYPIILPSNHPVVKRLIFEKHLERHHAGVSTLMSDLRENFWILKSRKCIRNVIRKCVKCKRFETPRVEVEPGILPEDRVKEAAIFEVVGIDLAGPLYLSDGTKSWIVLFTCAVYRAVHLELVSSLSTDSFMQSLRRFIARRGRPSVIYTDNGKNFVGTDRALADIDWNTIRAETTTQKIRWKFNPPSAAWWGGWWERLVRMVKEILRKVLGRASLNYEELNTILCDVEELINSRPITYISEDNQDNLPLTPKMFLQELPSSGVPDIDAIDKNSLNRRAKYRQRIKENLRNRFRSEYLGQLRQHAIKKEYLKQLKVGDIVLLEEVNKKRIHWPLARIIEIFPGKDNVVRLAKVKTENGVLLRPVQRLFPLEIEPTVFEHSTPLNSSSSSSPVISRAGRVIRPPERLQL